MTSSTTSNGPLEAGIEQLALLPAEDVPIQLRLSERTRRVGLAGIARARAILAEQAARRQRETALAAEIAPPRTPQAAPPQTDQTAPPQAA